MVGRAPQGARGLKFILRIADSFILMSRPARGAWVEIRRRRSQMPQQPPVAPRKGRVG